MTVHGFYLACAGITEVVILTRRRIPTLRSISISELIIASKPAVKYLGLMLDSKMSFFKQINAAADKAAARVSALSRLMVNEGGPISARRRPLMAAMQPVLGYGTVVWDHALDGEVHRKRLAQVKKRSFASGISSSHCLKTGRNGEAGVIPVALLAKERKALTAGKNLREVFVPEERQHTLTQRQLSWQNDPRGR